MQVSAIFGAAHVRDRRVDSAAEHVQSLPVHPLPEPVHVVPEDAHAGENGGDGGAVLLRYSFAGAALFRLL